MKYYLLASLILFLLEIFIFPAKGQNVGSCFSSSFSRAIGFILRGHLLAEFDVDQVIDCKKKCILSSNCLSLNIIKGADGSLSCHLNSGLKENSAREQFVANGAGEYYGLKEKRLCFNHGDSCDTVSSWHTFNQSYFQHVKTPLTWQEAREVCLANNGDLASISSEEEQRFLYETFIKNDPSPSSAFLGLNDINEEGKFVWSDGSPVSHAKFGGNEPDNGGGNEDCVVMRTDSSSFSDRPCTTKIAFLCEVDYDNLYKNA